ncbi:MAG: hypothetical protein ABSH46_15120 [Bryobacteraceae bacterium]|jgi:hypothetical protein
MSDLVLTATQIEVLGAIDFEGWYYGEAWFPTVQRSALNFPDGPSDEEVHAALFSLIELGVLEVWRVLENDEEVRIKAPPPEVLAELRRPNAETDVKLHIRAGVIEEVEANERRKWIEIRNTE